MKFAICQELFEDTPWDQQCDIIADVGYTGIEVAPFTIAEDLASVSDATLGGIRQTANSAGLEVIGLHWLLAKTDGLHLTSADPNVRKTTTEYLKLLARTCGMLGGKVLVFGSPPQRTLPPQMTMQDGLKYATEVFQNAMPEFAAHGVQLCMEPLTAKETDFINTCDDAVQLMNKVDHPAFVLHQDVKAMLGAERDSIPELIHRHASVCGHFHVNDINLLGPGMGETDFHPIFEALLEVQYQGWVSVEVFDYSPGAKKIAKKSLQYMRSVLSDVEGAKDTLK
ncbi:MAG: sugar phosphate isomerase/epimerase family protein [Fuerstiella sp.]